jgi:hypothetical protein
MAEKMTLEEYYRSHPYQGDPDREKEEAAYRAEQARKAKDAARADRLKEMLGAGIREATPPEFLLYTAVELLGILYDDPDWKTPLIEKLESMYGDLAQGSFLINQRAVVMDRLRTAQEEDGRKLRKALETQRRRASQMAANIQEAINQLDALEGSEEPQGEPETERKTLSRENARVIFGHFQDTGSQWETFPEDWNE